MDADNFAVWSSEHVTSLTILIGLVRGMCDPKLLRRLPDRILSGMSVPEVSIWPIFSYISCSLVQIFLYT